MQWTSNVVENFSYAQFVKSGVWATKKDIPKYTYVCSLPRLAHMGAAEHTSMPVLWAPGSGMDFEGCRTPGLQGCLRCPGDSLEGLEFFSRNKIKEKHMSSLNTRDTGRMGCFRNSFIQHQLIYKLHQLQQASALPHYGSAQRLLLLRCQITSGLNKSSFPADRISKNNNCT